MTSVFRDSPQRSLSVEVSWTAERHRAGCCEGTQARSLHLHESLSDQRSHSLSSNMMECLFLGQWGS